MTEDEYVDHIRKRALAALVDPLSQQRVDTRDALSADHAAAPAADSDAGGGTS